MAELSDLTAACIRCGFCLEACPTFVLSGDEALSPRGRIQLAKEGVFLEGVEAFDSCLGCLACETACPSGVQYGAILEESRSRLEAKRPRAGLKGLLAMVTRPTLLRAAITLGGLLPGRRLPERASHWIGCTGQALVPAAPAHSGWPPYDGPEGWEPVPVLRGCAMDVMFPHVHEATERLLRRVGFQAVWSRGCCGALHSHAGYADQGGAMALRHPAGVLTNSAGCGSHLHGSKDVCSFLIRQGLARLLASAPPYGVRVAYMDACHLAHGQGVRSAPRKLLAAVPGLELVELDDPHCCGSAGLFSMLRPETAGALLERKWASFLRSGAEVLLVGNPGCLSWLAGRAHGTRFRVAHTLEVLEEVLT
ncbi:MAG: (Fe-S)-binding protein [Fimbriimonadaceae bacterium]